MVVKKGCWWNAFLLLFLLKYFVCVSYLYFILLNVLNWEAGKGVRKTLNSMKTGLGGEKCQFNLKQRKRVVAEDECFVVPKDGNQTELSQWPELQWCCSGGINHSTHMIIRVFTTCIILPAFSAAACILPCCMAASFILSLKNRAMNFKEAPYPFLLCSSVQEQDALSGSALGRLNVETVTFWLQVI